MRQDTTQELDRLTNRHLGKLLDQLDEINTSEIVKAAIKKEFWWLNRDVKAVLSRGSDE